jgi:DNA-binding transcriptional ArsR family regulator
MSEPPGLDEEVSVPLPEDVPVEMPQLPLMLALGTAQQFKAFGDPVRVRILGIIQQQPATAMQVARQLGMPPGTIGHHLQVLEKAGLAQVVARRVVRGIVAKYYTRTARIFTFHCDDQSSPYSLDAGDLLSQARDELVESLAAFGKDASMQSGYPRVRLTPERARMYGERLGALIDEFLAEQPDPGGRVYALLGAFFPAPPYIQGLKAEVQGVEGAHGGDNPGGDNPGGDNPGERGGHREGERDDARAHTD